LLLKNAICNGQEEFKTINTYINLVTKFLGKLRTQNENTITANVIEV
jgi:hypothetical protein